MIMMGLKFMGDVPFKKVYITPLVRDEEGRKMSKSLGNAIDPLGIVEQYGSDALRFALAWLTIQGRDIHLSLKRIEAARSFVNKLWNAARFVLMNLEGFAFLSLTENALDLKDRWILSRLNKVIQEATVQLENLEFGGFVQLLYDFVWSEYCDWYLEWSKRDLYRGTERERRKTQNILLTILSHLLRLLHPVIPFVTEEIWQHLPLPYKERESIMVSSWPQGDTTWTDKEAEKDVAFLQGVVREIRYLRSELGVSPAFEGVVWLSCTEAERVGFLSAKKEYVEQLTKCIVERVGENIPRPPHVALGRVQGVDVYFFVEGVVDVEKEERRLLKKIENLSRDLERITKKLEDARFLAQAPLEVVTQEKERYTEIKEEIARLKRLLEGIL